MKQKPRKLRFFATRNQKLRHYQLCPQLLAEDLLMIFSPVENDKDMGVHNHLCAKIFEYCPDFDDMLVRVARSINESARNSGAEAGITNTA